MSEIHLHDYFISTDKILIDREKLWLMLKDCFWSQDIPIEVINKFIKYSLCFGVYQKNDKKLVGFGRVITDYTTYAYVCDVIIDVLHRRRRLGNALFKAIVNHPELQQLKTWS